VCGGQLERVKNRTIYGGKVTLEFPMYFYWVLDWKEKENTELYVFHLKCRMYEEMNCAFPLCSDREQREECQSITRMNSLYKYV